MDAAPEGHPEEAPVCDLISAAYDFVLAQKWGANLALVNRGEEIPAHTTFKRSVCFELVERAGNKMEVEIPGAREVKAKTSKLLPGIRKAEKIGDSEQRTKALKDLRELQDEPSRLGTLAQILVGEDDRRQWDQKRVKRHLSQLAKAAANLRCQLSPDELESLTLRMAYAQLLLDPRMQIVRTQLSWV